MFKDSIIYVAGHSGMLGSAILKKLESKGYSNLLTETHKSLDLCNQKETELFFHKKKPEYVFLCAGKVGGILSNMQAPEEYKNINLSIQNNVFNAALNNGVKCLVFFGSSCIYPKDAKQPIKEDYLLSGEMENTSLGYSTAKLAGINACKEYNIKYEEKRFIALVPNSMYGPGDNFDLQNSHVLSALIRRFHEAKLNGKDEVTLWGSGKPRREFVFVDDVADAAIFAVENKDKLENRHYNIGTGTDCSIFELAEIISNVVGYKGRINWDSSKPDGVLQKLLDSSSMNSLGWRTETGFVDGIKITYNWFKENYDKLV